MRTLDLFGPFVAAMIIMLVFESVTVLCDESCVPAVGQSGSAESTELFVETWETRKSNFQV